MLRGPEAGRRVPSPRGLRPVRALRPLPAAPWRRLLRGPVHDGPRLGLRAAGRRGVPSRLPKAVLLGRRVARGGARRRLASPPARGALAHSGCRGRPGRLICPGAEWTRPRSGDLRAGPSRRTGVLRLRLRGHPERGPGPLLQPEPLRWTGRRDRPGDTGLLPGLAPARRDLCERPGTPSVRLPGLDPPHRIRLFPAAAAERRGPCGKAGLRSGSFGPGIFRRPAPPSPAGSVPERLPLAPCPERRDRAHEPLADAAPVPGRAPVHAVCRGTRASKGSPIRAGSRRGGRGRNGLRGPVERLRGPHVPREGVFGPADPRGHAGRLSPLEPGPDRHLLRLLRGAPELRERGHGPPVRIPAAARGHKGNRFPAFRGGSQSAGGCHGFDHGRGGGAAYA